MRKILLLLAAVLIFGLNGNLLVAQDWVGSEACSGCHATKYNDWIQSGHPYKFTVIENNQPPVYPPEVINFQDEWMPNLGDGTHTWADVAGVIGGYGWKTRFVGQDGHVIGTAGSAYSTGFGHNQFNFYGGENHGWVDYNPGDEKIYNYSCFKCHTTGGTQEGTWLPAVEGLGTFTEQGIGCESCHGPGGDHIQSPSSSNIDLVYEFAHLDNDLGGLEVDGVVQTPDPNGNDVNFLCGTCHNRSYTDPINASGGFIKHHEQWDEFMATEHNAGGMDCNTCHDPHKRVIWEGDGIVMNCATCHDDQVSNTNHSASATCVDCHMPFAAKSGTTRGESGFKGDVRSHLFKIIPDTADMFVPNGSAVRDDDERPAALSPAFSCLGCHNDDPNDAIPDKTLEEAVAGAMEMHGPTGVSSLQISQLGLYPNPSAGLVNITFDLERSQNTTLTIYDANGRIVFNQPAEFKSAGSHTIVWDGQQNNGSAAAVGYYFVQLNIGEISTVKKLVISK